MARESDQPKLPATPAMTRGFDGPPNLAVHRAFVVHFAATGGQGRRRFRGRVEHLSSGRAAEFSSLQALLGFVGVVLDALEPAAVAGPAPGRRRQLGSFR